MRGENCSECGMLSNTNGSPPHAWGKYSGIGIIDGADRFTPTCVGKISSDPDARCQPAVHPHMRGENVLSIKLIALLLGSPPHAWGKCVYYVHTLIIYRFTPTCVGKIGYRSQSLSQPPVHPHMRGENFPSTVSSRTEPGSPPHAWGKYRSIHCVMIVRRFTPTCVGKMCD